MNLYGDDMYNKAVEIAKNAPQKYRPGDFGVLICGTEHIREILIEFGDGVDISIPEQYIIVLDEN